VTRVGWFTTGTPRQCSRTITSLSKSMRRPIRTASSSGSRLASG
jgi:hypothetical protein